MIETRNLCFSYEEKKVLKNIDISLNKGKLTCLLGANGSGKTTIIKALNGIIKKDSGQIFIDGENLDNLKQKEIAKKISMVPQEHNSVFSYKSIDVVIMGVTPYLGFGKQPDHTIYLKAKKIMDKLNILEMADRNYNELSGGERQLVLIARALLQDTEYMLFDEPTSHLDFKNQHLILRELKKLTKKQKGVVTALHDPNLALKYSDQVIIIKEGKILTYGETEKVMNSKNLSKAYETEIIVDELANKVEIAADNNPDIKEVI
ncbi:MAG: ABC transporter ATP-binding protein [Bacillota bacterium]